VRENKTSRGRGKCSMRSYMPRGDLNVEPRNRGDRQTREKIERKATSSSTVYTSDSHPIATARLRRSRTGGQTESHRIS
jgi:hypothetical protein